MIVTLAEAKEYLRVDTNDEDDLIETLIKAAQRLCECVARLESEEYEAAGEVAKVAVLFAVGTLYQNREDTNTLLMPRLRSLLFGIRKAAF